MREAEFGRRPNTQTFKTIARTPGYEEPSGLTEQTDGYAIFPSDTREFDLRENEDLLSEAEDVLESQEDVQNIAILAHRSFPSARRSVLVALTESQGPLVVDDVPTGSDADHRSSEAFAASLETLDELVSAQHRTSIWIEGEVAIVVVRDGLWISLSEHPSQAIGRLLSVIRGLEEGS